MPTMKSISVLMGLVALILAAPAAEVEVKAPMSTGAVDPSFFAEEPTSPALGKREDCNDHLGPESFADVNDAVECINYLASLGNTPCTVSVSGTSMCNIRGTQITGLAVGGPTYATSSCNDVARAAGRIMDLCSRGDGKVKGSWYAWGNGYLLVDIRRV